METGLIVAGFGGQGVLLIGQLIAYFGMLDGKEVSWMPSTARRCAAAAPTAPSSSPTSPSAAPRWRSRTW